MYVFPEKKDVLCFFSIYLPPWKKYLHLCKLNRDKAMGNIVRKLPIGIQSFDKLRTENYLYVDKTEFIYQMAYQGVPLFP